MYDILIDFNGSQINCDSNATPTTQTWSSLIQ